MNAVRALIVDDEPLARDTVRILLEGRDDVEIVGECASGEEAIESIAILKPELVFLDIQMPAKNGFDVIAEVGPADMPEVIFATAFDEYAVKAFEVNALDYLLKPFDDDRFNEAVTRAISRIQAKSAQALGEQLSGLLARVRPSDSPSDAETTDPGSLQRLLVKTKSGTIPLRVSEIDWFEAAGDYVTLHVGTKTHLIRDSLSRLEKALDPTGFVRIHRSYIVNIDRIATIQPYFHGDQIVKLKDGSELKLSRRYWSRVEEVLGS